ncbi:MAG: lipopolysaccharide biosynthesis protein [Acidimicrobiales bacterium]
MSAAPSPTRDQNTDRGDHSAPLGAGTRSSFARDSLTSILGNWGSFVIGALGGLILSRTLQPEGKGVYTALYTVALIAGTTASLGTDMWVSRRAAEIGIDARLRSLVHRHMVAIAFAGLVVAFGVILFAPSITTIRVAPLLLVVGGAVTLGWQGMINSIYRGRRKVRQLVAVQLTNAAGFLLAVALLATKGQLSIDAALAIPLATRLVSIATPTTFRVLRSSLTTWTEWFWIVREHLTVSIGLLIEFAIYRMDIFVVGALLGPARLGIYSVALPLSELLWIAPNAIAQVLFPHIAASRSTTATETITRLTVIISCVGGIGLVLVGPSVITFAYGEPFSDAGSVLPMLAFAAVLLAVWKIVTTDLLARGDSSARTRGAFAALVVLVIVLPPLTTWLGIRGAAAATAIAYLAALIHGVRVWSRLPDASVKRLVPVDRNDLSLIREAVRGRSA